MQLHGKRALITGSNGGIGQALAIGLADAGAEIILHSRLPGKADSVAELLHNHGHTAQTVHGDVSTNSEVERFVTEAVDSDERGVDILVNNAGRMSTTPFLELTEDEWRRVLDTNLGGYFLVGQAVSRHMVDRGSGSIVNISSTRESQAWPGSSAYAVSKAAISMLTRSMALELAPMGVRVNSVSPGTFVTNLNRHYLSDPEFASRRTDSIPMRRLGEVSELVGAVLYLCSADATFTTGASIMVDGGQTLW